MSDRRVSKALLYENVVKKLVEMIDQGLVGPGEQFPTERELVEIMQVSRNVLREAFHILEEKGIISSFQGKGRFLRKLPDRHADRPTVMDLQKYSLLELYQVRSILEMGTMEILADQATEEDLNDLEQTYEKLAALFLERDSTEGEFEMHMAYAKKSRNEYLLSLIRDTTNRVLRIMWGDFSKVVTNYRVESFIEDHRAILRALHARNAISARTLMLEHLNKTSHNIKLFPTTHNFT